MSSLIKIVCTFLFTTSMLVLSAQTRFEYEHQQMGTQIRLIFYASDYTVADSVSKEAFKRIDDLNEILSDYIKDSELNDFCRQAPETTLVSDELYDVLRTSKEISKNTHGAFDITIGPLVGLWRTARKKKKLPSSSDIRNALKHVGYEKISLLGKNRVQLQKKGMKLDLGGIGKGFTADEVMKVLKNLGITSALIDMGGDILVSNPPPEKEDWTLAFTYYKESGEEIVQKIKLRNQAVATSGDLFQFVEIDNTRYSHIVAPQTGMALTSRIQVSVIAHKGALADGYASALSVMGIDKTEQQIESMKNLAVFATEKVAGEYRQWNSDGFEDFTFED